MNIFRFILPASYFIESRLKSVKDFIFHFYYEWIITFLLLWYFSDGSFGNALFNYSLGYLAFISIYELGYLGNDLFSVQFEKTPRRRIEDFDPTIKQLAFWVISRLLLFVFITMYLNLWNNTVWLLFYSCLVLAFTFHNLIRENKWRAFTFVLLTVLRYFAPIFIFIGLNKILLIVPSVLLNYVIYRTYNYIQSKAFFPVPYIANTKFKVNYYLLVLFISIGLSFLFHSIVPALIAVYYTIFWITVLIFNKNSFKPS